MNYYIDNEFLEGPQKKRFLGIPYGETPNTIDLISIGIVSEDGREYYALNKDCNFWEAWNRFDIKEDFGKPQGLGDKKLYWIRDIVLLPIYLELVHGDMRNYRPFTFSTMQWVFRMHGTPFDKMREDIKDFVSRKYSLDTSGLLDLHGVTSDLLSTFKGRMDLIKYKFGGVNFFGYYADYDWVVFCWIFGRMIDLPAGFPMYCNDLKQMLDEKVEKMTFTSHTDPNTFYNWTGRDHMDKALSMVKGGYPGFPPQQNEHSAICDARWAKKLHEFIKSF